MARESFVHQLDTWHRTRFGRLIGGLVELILAYLLGSRAVYTGSYWQYGLAIVFTVGGIINLVKVFKRK